MTKFFKIYALLFLVVTILFGCQKIDWSKEGVDFRQNMRDFVIHMSAYARSVDSNFIVIPQNGQELITRDGETTGLAEIDYISAIDGTGREDLFFGYKRDDKETPEDEMNYMLDLCLVFKQYNLSVLTIDYCSTRSNMDRSYSINASYDFISFAANERNLNNIPDYPSEPYNLNTANITSLSEAKNFLYLINSENFSSKQDFINHVSTTNYDLIIMDLFHEENQYTFEEIQQLKTKANGGSRLVVCYMSIGEAEDYRAYWQTGWKEGNPDWIIEENPDWKGNYKVKYWNPDWQKIIFGNPDAYLDQILSVGFDGVYLDIIDAFEYFEN